MSRHAKFEADEVQERYRAEFTTGMAGLERTEWAIRDLLDIVEDLLQHRAAA